MGTQQDGLSRTGPRLGSILSVQGIRFILILSVRCDNCVLKCKPFTRSKKAMFRSHVAKCARKNVKECDRLILELGRALLWNT